jgi:hypothetical protein
MFSSCPVTPPALGTTVFAAMPWPCGYPEAGIVGLVQRQTDHGGQVIVLYQLDMAVVSFRCYFPRLF